MKDLLNVMGLRTGVTVWEVDKWIAFYIVGVGKYIILTYSSDLANF